MRERAFAVLGDRVVGSDFLDLYAGTGAVGLEALSRGARRVVFVERHSTAARIIQRNLVAFELGSDRAELLLCSASAAVGRLARRQHSFDIVWADPPFEDWTDGLEVVVMLFDEGLLRERIVACFECPEKADVASILPAHLEIVRDLGGGASRVVMITRR
jgi:16S rRNA (guanine(966)-N(2))-methyltransferase RsmD